MARRISQHDLAQQLLALQVRLDVLHARAEKSGYALVATECDVASAAMEVAMSVLEGVGV
jgi:hypothetical protein